MNKTTIAGISIVIITIIYTGHFIVQPIIKTNLELKSAIETQKQEYKELTQDLAISKIDYRSLQNEYMEVLNEFEKDQDNDIKSAKQTIITHDKVIDLFNKLKGSTVYVSNGYEQYELIIE